MNAQHERNFFLRGRLKGEHLLRDDVAAQLEVPGRTSGLLAQIAFFVLTCVALGAFYGLTHICEIKFYGLVTGVVAIVLAEYLIGAKRWFFTGVEAALWLGGLLALISELPHSGKPEALLVVAAVGAIAGLRVRNPLFGAAAAIFVMVYFEERFNLGVVYALSIAFAACLALLRTWRRPTTEALWIALALVMPIVGRFTADPVWRDTTISLYLILGAVALLLGIAKRHHALFLTAMIAFAIAGRDLSEKVTVPLEAKLALDGALLLALSFAISRLLRDRTRGFVLTPIQLTPLDDALQTAATLVFQPTSSAPPEPPPAPSGGGGSFGGAGASGDY